MKKIYLLTLLSLGFGSAEAQTFNWANRGGLYAYDYGYGIVNDNSGNVYVAGKYEGHAFFSPDSLPNQGNHDIFLVKYDAAGALTWIRSGGGFSGDYAHSVACDGANYVYVAGEIEAGGTNQIIFPGSTVTLNCVGGNDAFLCKYDLNGNLLWAKSEGGFNNDKALGVTYDASGNIFICGLFVGPTTFNGTMTVNGSGVEDIFIAKYDANGNFLWVKTAGGTGRDEPKSIKCDAAGNVYMCGFYSNNATFGVQTYSTTSGAYFDTFLAKYDTNGSLIWVKTAGGNFDDVAWSLTMDNAGLLYIAGEFNASAFFGPNQLITSGNADVFVACYDANGVDQWAKKAGGPLIDRARGIGCDGTNIYITGQFGSAALFGTNSLNAADSSDIFFASLDNAGNFLKAMAVGGVADASEPLGYESGIAICAEASGNVYATGSTLNGGIFGGITLAPYTRTDVFVTKITQLVNVNSLAAVSESILVYPNPGKGNFIIDLDPTIYQKTEMSVFNCYGQMLERRMETSSSKINVDLSAQQSGVYYLELRSENKNTIRKKLIVQN